MGKTLYLECSSGISGDMMVASLLDMGADWEHLLKVLGTVKAEGYEVHKRKVKKAGIECMDFDVVLDAAHENHDHDMEYLHGSDPAHHHEDEHHHEHHHHHEHRGMKEITEIIQACRMTERAKNTALKIFRIIAEAEAKAHGVSIGEVHFHEVGAIDSIIDVISVAVCLDDLDIEDVIVTRLCEGTGTVRCQHGILPIPVPAVSNIMAAYHLPIQITDVEGELVTPTGAAIVAAVKTKDKLPETFTIKKTGYGAGKRTYRRPSILRAMLIEENAEDEHSTKYAASAEFIKSKENAASAAGTKGETNTDFIYKLETNVDDCTGEELGAVMEELFRAGARDAFYTPVYMKKNRPGYQLNVICSEKDIETLEHIIFTGTTTIGIRRQKWERTILPREILEVETPYGKAKVKKCRIGDVIRYYPEYESVLEISRRENLSYREVYQAVVRVCDILTQKS
ncbi:MAG: nickel pincer cofactor biosynthesis protein LarC [Lachnospiraceae bacterium]